MRKSVYPFLGVATGGSKAWAASLTISALHMGYHEGSAVTSWLMGALGLWSYVIWPVAAVVLIACIYVASSRYPAYRVPFLAAATAVTLSSIVDALHDALVMGVVR